MHIFEISIRSFDEMNYLWEFIFQLALFFIVKYANILSILICCIALGIIIIDARSFGIVTLLWISPKIQSK